MAKKAKGSPVAVIDIGSNGLRMKIAEPGKNILKYIESLSYPLSLGRDTFDFGSISFEKVDKACGVIKNFMTVAEACGVDNIRVVTTTAVREAANRDYILDQIKIKTTLDVDVLDDSDEKLYIYKLITHLLEPKRKKAAMMVYVGSGNVGVSVLKDGRMPYIQNIRIGSLRISEMLTDMQDDSSEYYRVVEEYLQGAAFMPGDAVLGGLTHFIASGHEVALIAPLCGAVADGPFLSIPKERFLGLYNEMKVKTTDRLERDYNVPPDMSHVLLPAMSILRNLLGATEAEEIIAPNVYLTDAVIFKMLYPSEYGGINKAFSRNTILSARACAARYNADESHGENVRRHSVKIFDKMKKIHGMGQRDKLYLQTASILHDIGRFINPRQHYIHSYHIVSASEIVGLNALEKRIVACMCLFHTHMTPSMSHEAYASLSAQHRVLMSKLTAIMRLADALDAGGGGKFGDIDVRVAENELIVTIASDKNMDFEDWSFKNKSLFFEEVFGIKAVLRRRAL